MKRKRQSARERLTELHRCYAWDDRCGPQRMTAFARLLRAHERELAERAARMAWTQPPWRLLGMTDRQWDSATETIAESEQTHEYAARMLVAAILGQPRAKKGARR